MKLYYLFLFILSGIISAIPVIICQEFYNGKNYSFYRILGFIAIIGILSFIIFGSCYYYIYEKIKIGQFYPIIKIVETIVPIIISIYIYEQHYKLINYLGILVALVAIIMITY